MSLQQFEGFAAVSSGTLPSGSIVAAAATITSGGSTTLTPTFSNGTGSIDYGVGAVTSTVGISTGTLTTTTTFTLTVTDTFSNTATATVLVTVVAAPAITSFVCNAANAPYVTNGNTTTFTAVFSGGTGSIDHSVGAVTSTIATGAVTPPSSATTTYTLTVTNAATSPASATATVNVTSVIAPAISSFTANPATYVTNGNTSDLTPIFSNGTGVITPGPISVTSGNVYTVTPPNNTATTYTLTVTNQAGSTATRTVNITAVLAPTCTSLTTSAIYVTNGGTVTLTPTFSNGTGSINSYGAVTSGVGAVVTPPSNFTTTYILTVTNAAGSICNNTTVNVTAVAAPSISSFITLAAIVTDGSTTQIQGTFANGTGSVSPSPGAVTSTTYYVVTPPSDTTTTYTLTVTNLATTAVTATLTIQAVAAPICTSLTSSLTYLDSNHPTTTLTPNFSGGTGAITYSGGTLASNVTTGQGYSATPGSTITYTLTVTNAAGSTCTSTVTPPYVALPTCTSFTTNATYIDSGHNATITPTFSNGTGSINNGGPSNPTSGQGYSVNYGSTITYTLTVTNQAGSTCTLTVTVNYVALPTCTSFSTNANYIDSGHNAIITPVFSNGTGVINQGVTSNASTGQGYTVNYGSTVTYTLTVTNQANSTCTRTVTVNYEALPTCNSLTTNHIYLDSGHTIATLTPVFSGGTGVISGVGGQVYTGQGYSVTPTSTVTYTLTVTNDAGSTCTKTVTVYGGITLPTCTSLTTNLTYLDSNHNTASLTPLFSNGTGSIDHSVGAVTNNVGASTGVLSTTTTFTLTVTNQAGSTCTSTVTVNYVALPTCTSLTAHATYLDSNHTSTYIIPVYSNGTGTINGTSAPSGSNFNVSPVTTTLYTLTVTNQAGSTCNNLNVSVNYIALPTSSGYGYTTNPYTSYGIQYNTSVTLQAGTFSPSGTTGSFDHSIGSVSSGGTKTYGPLTTQTTFVLTVTNYAGSTATYNIVVQVWPASSNTSCNYASNGATTSWTAPGTGKYFIHLWLQGGGQDGDLTTSHGGGGGEYLSLASMQVTGGTGYTFNNGNKATYGNTAGSSSLTTVTGTATAAGAYSTGHGGGSTGGAGGGNTGGAGAGPTGGAGGGSLYGGGGGGGKKLKLSAGSATGWSGGSSNVPFSGGIGGTATGDGSNAGTAGGGGGAGGFGNGGLGGDGNCGSGTPGQDGRSYGSGGGGGGDGEAGGLGICGGASWFWPYTS